MITDKSDNSLSSKPLIANSTSAGDISTVHCSKSDFGVRLQIEGGSNFSYTP